MKMLHIILFTLTIASACNNNKESTPQIPTSDYGIISNDIANGFVLEVDIDKPIKNMDKVFNGGGQRYEWEYTNADIVMYWYDNKEVKALTKDKKTSIYYLSTKDREDKTIRGIGVGDSLDELLKAYPENQLILQETWDGYGSGFPECDIAYKLVVDDEKRQMVFLLKENEIVMIQIADMQDNDNTGFDFEFYN